MSAASDFSTNAVYRTMASERFASTLTSLALCSGHPAMTRLGSCARGIYTDCNVFDAVQRSKWLEALNKASRGTANVSSPLADCIFTHVELTGSFLRAESYDQESFERDVEKQEKALTRLFRSIAALKEENAELKGEVASLQAVGTGESSEKSKGRSILSKLHWTRRGSEK